MPRLLSVDFHHQKGSKIGDDEVLAVREAAALEEREVVLVGKRQVRNHGETRQEVLLLVLHLLAIWEGIQVQEDVEEEEEKDRLSHLSHMEERIVIDLHQLLLSYSLLLLFPLLGDVVVVEVEEGTIDVVIDIDVIIEGVVQLAEVLVGGEEEFVEVHPYVVLLAMGVSRLMRPHRVSREAKENQEEETDEEMMEEGGDIIMVEVDLSLLPGLRSDMLGMAARGMRVVVLAVEEEDVRVRLCLLPLLIIHVKIEALTVGVIDAAVVHLLLLLLPGKKETAMNEGFITGIDPAIT